MAEEAAEEAAAVFAVVMARAAAVAPVIMKSAVRVTKEQAVAYSSGRPAEGVAGCCRDCYSTWSWAVLLIT